MVTKIHKNKTIKFNNMQSLRVGKGIRELRKIREYSQKDLSDKVGITVAYLNLLEEGHEPEVERETMEKITEVLGVCRRGTKYTDEDIINVFLHYASKSYKYDEDNEPRLL